MEEDDIVDGCIITVEYKVCNILTKNNHFLDVYDVLAEDLPVFFTRASELCLQPSIVGFSYLMGVLLSPTQFPCMGPCLDLLPLHLSTLNH